MTLFRILVALALAGFSAGALACPDYSKDGDKYEFSGKELYTPKRFELVAGGGSELRSCHNVEPASARGRGWVTTRPDFTFYLSSLSGYDLDIRVTSECDAVLLVNSAAANWYYDDDGNGNLDPQVRLSNPSSGWYDVWVGTFDGRYCDATLTLETY